MAETLSHFWLFLGAVCRQYVVLASGGVLTVMVAIIERHWLKKQISYKAEIAVLAIFILFACFGAWDEQYRATKPPAATTVQVNMPPQNPPQVQVNVPPTTVNLPPQEAYFGPDGSPKLVVYSIGQYVQLNTECKNFSSSIPAEDALCQLKAYFVNTKLNSQNQPIVPESEQKRTFDLFEKERPKNLPLITIAPNDSRFGTMSPGILDQNTDIDLRRAAKTILVAGRYTWRDGGGTHVDESCKWLQIGPNSGSDIFAGPGELKPTITMTWNSCTRHNGVKR